MNDGQTIDELGELSLVDRLAARVPPAPAHVTLGIGDDAAVVAPVRHELDVLTTDALVEGVHFTQAFSAASDVGHKALAVNLSDLAAMGATPRVALLSLALPRSLPVAWFDGCLDGLLALATRHGVSLVGGNLTTSPGPIVVDVTLVGSVHPRKVLRRTTARRGDALYVTGTIGAGVAGLAALSGEGGASRTPEVASAIDAYRRPSPRVRIGRVVGRSRSASAAIDLSDGLADGVRRLAEGSGLGAVVDATAVPWHPAVAAVVGTTDDAWARALSGGDDYELLLAVPRRRDRAFQAAVRSARDVGVTRIGEFVEGTGTHLVRDGHDVAWPAGFAHFG